MDMIDLVVRLYTLPKLEPYLQRIGAFGVSIRRARAYEKYQVVEWIREHFSNGWASECEVAFSRVPLSCLIATREQQIVGFICHEATYKNFIGPLGIHPEYRNREIGSALLISSLYAMQELGYAYAILGGPTNAAPLYRRLVDAIDIPGSTPGIYIDLLAGADSFD
jgi:GNAT superfamily N-acetyltransferase